MVKVKDVFYDDGKNLLYNEFPKMIIDIKKKKEKED